jgi:hypothetical protein
MVNKIIITESQYNRLIETLANDSHFDIVLGDVLEDLNKNYEKVTAVVHNGRDYKEGPRIKIKASGNIIKDKDLLEYMKFTYHEVCGEDFLKTVIDEWYHDRIVNGYLSKNITLK